MDDQKNITRLDKIRIERGLGKVCKCKNRTFIIDTDNRRVTCGQCGAVIDPYDALYDIAFEDERRNESLERMRAQAEEIANYKPYLKVIKRLEKDYRGRKMLPNCPRCHQPFYLEELTSWTGRKFAEALIEKHSKQ